MAQVDGIPPEQVSALLMYLRHNFPNRDWQIESRDEYLAAQMWLNSLYE